MQNGAYLFAAYTVIWVLLFGYVVTLIRRQARLRREIDLLRKSIEKQAEYEPLRESRGRNEVQSPNKSGFVSST
jgi:CcmD family protein